MLFYLFTLYFYIEKLFIVLTLLVSFLIYFELLTTLRSEIMDHYYYLNMVLHIIIFIFDQKLYNLKEDGRKYKELLV